MENSLEDVLSEIFERLCRTYGEPFSMQVMSIVRRNIGRDRLDFELVDPVAQAALLDKYAQRVADCYQVEGAVVEALQDGRDSVLWEEKWGEIYQWAWFAIRQKWPTVPYNTCQQLAEEIAPEASMRIMTSEFSFDTSFDAWVRVIVRYVTLEVLRRHIRDTNKIEQIEDVEEYDSWSTITPDLSSALAQEHNRQLIDQALAKLSERQATIIRLRYFEGLDLAEIAQQLELEKNNVYQSHFQALRNLGKHLTKSPDFER